jgi:very-short-patch-repair endonuclease
MVLRRKCDERGSEGLSVPRCALYTPVRDVRIAELAGRQFNRVSRAQLRALGVSKDAIEHRVLSGRLVIVEQGVFAVAPVLDDEPWGRWMGATLTEPASLLSRLSAAVAWGALSREGRFTKITRPGTGGPRRHGGVIVHRSTRLDGDRDELRGIPITSIARTLLDITGVVGDVALARAVREAVRLERTTLYELADALGRYSGWRGSRRLAATVARYSGLPIERARSGAEVRALEILRAAGHSDVSLNRVIGGEEADLVLPKRRLIIEIDGGPFHLDRGEDARKEAAWAAAGWTVRRLPSDEVYERPSALLTLIGR